LWERLTEILNGIKMKKLLTIILIFFALISYGQLTTNLPGDVKWDYIHAIGSADSVNVALTGSAISIGDFKLYVKKVPEN